MHIQNLQDVDPKIMSAHGGMGLIKMFFFHQDLQNYSEKLKIFEKKNPNNNSMWNFFAYSELPVGSTVKRHKHTKTDELYFILEGKAIITVDDERGELKKGDVLLTKNNSSHSIDEVLESLKFIAIEVLIYE